MATENRSNGSLEDGLRGVYQRASHAVSEQIHQCEDSVREAPANSLLMAAAAGYFVHLLPIGAVLSGILRLLTALIRPAVFLYVAAKGYELVRSSAKSAPNPADSEREMASP